MNDSCEKLINEGWREYPDQFRKDSRCFFKWYETPTRCACNDNKSGMQICFAMSEYEDVESIEVDICGELPDGTWIKIMQYGLPKDLDECLAVIPRMLAIWEAITNYKPL